MVLKSSSTSSSDTSCVSLVYDRGLRDSKARPHRVLIASDFFQIYCQAAVIVVKDPVIVAIATIDITNLELQRMWGDADSSRKNCPSPAYMTWWVVHISDAKEGLDQSTHYSPQQLQHSPHLVGLSAWSTKGSHPDQQKPLSALRNHSQISQTS